MAFKIFLITCTFSETKFILRKYEKSYFFSVSLKQITWVLNFMRIVKVWGPARFPGVL